MKKILLVIESLGSGGAENQLCRLSVLLKNHGYDCRVVSYVKDQFYEPFLLANNVEYEFLEGYSSKPRRIIRMIKYIKNYHPDCVISYLSSVNKFLCVCRIFFNFKLIVSERNNELDLPDTKFYFLVTYNLYRFATYVVSNTHCLYEQIKRKFPFLVNKLFVIENVVDTDEYTPSEKVPSDHLRILTVGRFCEQKGCLKFLEAIKEIKNQNLPISFSWVGNQKFDAEYYKLCCKKVNVLDIADYITFENDTSKIVEKYQSADVFCLPSIYEGYPNVILEAMSCELPILCSNVNENPLVVENEVNGFLFDPNNVMDIVEKIKKMYSMSNENRLQMGKLNRSLCITRNSDDSFLSKYIRLIENE